MRGKSKRRIEMGEDKWEEHQKNREIKKTNDYKQRNARKVIEWRRRTKLKLIEYKGGKCERCGYDKPYSSCYDFHHRNPDEKEFRIGGQTKKLETLKKEVDKCDLLCKNCHFEIHDIEYKDLLEKRIKSIEGRQADMV